MCLEHGVWTQDFAGKLHEYPADAGCTGCQRKTAGIVQVGRAVRAQCSGRTHGAGEYDGPVRWQYQREEEGRFFQGVGAVGDDDGICRPRGALPRPHPRQQLQPVGAVHLLAGNREHLLRGQLSVGNQGRQTGDRGQNLADGQRTGLIAGGTASRGGRSGNGAAGAENQQGGRAGYASGGSVGMGDRGCMRGRGCMGGRDCMCGRRGRMVLVKGRGTGS